MLNKLGTTLADLLLHIADRLTELLNRLAPIDVSTLDSNLPELKTEYCVLNRNTNKKIGNIYRDYNDAQDLLFCNKFTRDDHYIAKRLVAHTDWVEVPHKNCRPLGT